MKVSVYRAALLFILVFFKKTFKIELKNYYILIFILSIMLFYNPYYLFSPSFYYSFIVTFYILVFSYNKKYENYFLKLFNISLVASLASFPITIYYFFEYNILSFIYNLIFIPIVTLVLFPVSVLSFVFSNEYILSYLIVLFENLVTYLNNDSFLIIFKRPNILLTIIYYFILFLYVKSSNIKYFMITILIILIIKNSNYFINYSKLYMIDVGMGESILFVMPRASKVFLFDTGGHFYDNEYNLSNYVIIPFIKSLGINRIDYLVITHGHLDHAKEAPNIIRNFDVNNVYLNSGGNNYLENKIVNVATKKSVTVKNISKYKIKVNDYTFNFINDVYTDENEDSLVCFITFDNYSVLLTGDIYKKQEEKILKNYGLKDIDVLKISHHGSNTSSSKKFLKNLNPKVSLISASKNNLYNLPSKKVLNNLNKYYKTSRNGMILIKFKEKMEIFTFF